MSGLIILTEKKHAGKHAGNKGKRGKVSCILKKSLK